MKKFLLSVITLSASLAANAQCNELFISEYVEGTGYDKAIEIYNPTNSAIDLTGYRLERFSNGSSSSSTGGVLNLSGTIAAHDVWVVTNNNGGTSPTSPALVAMADQPDNQYPAPTYMNGNDAIVLYKNTAIVDIFGKTGDATIASANGWGDQPPYDGSVGAVWTENHTLVRKASVTQGITVNPSSFIVDTEWDSLSVNTFTGLGAHACACLTGISELGNNVSVMVYPNPSNSDFFNISASEPVLNFEVYNVVGQRVIHQEGIKKDKQIKVETGNLAKGIYTVKVLFDNNKTSIVKISIQ